MPHEPHSPQATTIALHIRWNLHTLVTLQRLPSPLAPDPLDPALAFTHASPSALSTTTTFLIVSRLSTKVALLASPTGTSYAAKFYDTDQAAAWHVRKELAAYTTAQPVWGRSVPVFYGAWRVLGSVGVVLLMEAIVPGVPVGSLEVGERRGWHGRAVEAVREMNKAGVRHRGLCGEHVVLGEGGRVVCVSFGWAYARGARGWGVEDWEGLHRVFGGPEAERLIAEYYRGATWE